MTGNPFPPRAVPGLLVRENEPLAPRTTLRIGGPARWFAEAGTVEALAGLLVAAGAAGVPLLSLGKGSNLLVPDEGFPGLVFVLGGELASYRVDPPRIEAGGGAGLMALAVAARNAGLSGLEGLSGIPSTFGGAVRINAGAHGTEIFDLLEEVTVVTREGEARTLPASAIPRGYRWSALADGTDVVVKGGLRLAPAPRPEIEARMDEVAARRREALPAAPSAGSIFRNPPGHSAGRLLEECGMKGRRVGRAEVSERHANVVVNLGGATAADVRALVSEMQAAVRLRFGIDLVPEVEIVAFPPASVE